MNRRVLVGAIAWVAAAGAARSGMRPPPSLSRRLKLFNAHTRETFDGPYRGPNGVIDTAAADLSEFLRDHHSGVAVPMDIGVIDFLWDVLDAVGATDATVLSAYRTPETNAMLAHTTFGVAEHSQHVLARAVDFTIGSALGEAMTMARRMKRGGVGWYPQSHFIHLDTGPVRSWDLGDPNLQNLLTDPDNAARLRNAALPHGGQDATGYPAARASQYASQGIGEQRVRPSAYSARGSKDGFIRPSQYSGHS